jgi:hypothetical protein
MERVIARGGARSTIFHRRKVGYQPVKPDRAPVALLAAAFLIAACMRPQSAPQGTCDERPHCSFGPDPETPGNPLQQQLHCGPIHRYVGGDKAGFAAVGSFCPDSPATRRILHDNEKRGYLPGYCDTCLTVPAGQVFAFWKFFDGPSCPSGCVPGPPAF